MIITQEGDNYLICASKDELVELSQLVAAAIIKDQCQFGEGVAILTEVPWIFRPYRMKVARADDRLL